MTAGAAKGADGQGFVMGTQQVNIDWKDGAFPFLSTYVSLSLQFLW